MPTPESEILTLFLSVVDNSKLNINFLIHQPSLVGKHSLWQILNWFNTLSSHNTGELLKNFAINTVSAEINSEAAYWIM